MIVSQDNVPTSEKLIYSPARTWKFYMVVCFVDGYIVVLSWYTRAHQNILPLLQIKERSGEFQKQECEFSVSSNPRLCPYVSTGTGELQYRFPPLFNEI